MMLYSLPEKFNRGAVSQGDRPAPGSYPERYRPVAADAV